MKLLISNNVHEAKVVPSRKLAQAVADSLNAQWDLAVSFTVHGSDAGGGFRVELSNDGDVGYIVDVLP